MRQVCDLHLEARKQAASGMVDGSSRELVADLSLQKSLFCFREFGLGLEDEENGFGAQFVLVLLGLKRLLREIERHFSAPQETILSGPGANPEAYLASAPQPILLR